MWLQDKPVECMQVSSTVYCIYAGHREAASRPDLASNVSRTFLAKEVYRKAIGIVISG